VFESESRLREDVAGLLDALRSLAGGRYAVLFEAKGVVLDSPADGDPALRRFVESHARALLEIPTALQSGSEMQDHFADWEQEEFFLAFLNGRAGILAACTEAQRLEREAGPLLKVLADRLLRLNPAWRIDDKGRGFLAGRPRLDTVVIGRSEDGQD
jgi:hypothetical protein